MYRRLVSYPCIHDFCRRNLFLAWGVSNVSTRKTMEAIEFSFVDRRALPGLGLHGALHLLAPYNLFVFHLSHLLVPVVLSVFNRPNRGCMCGYGGTEVDLKFSVRIIVEVVLRRS